MSEFKIAVTGHRPRSITEFDIFNERWGHIKDVFESILLHYECTEAITGMALGTDQVFALAVLELKNEGHDILLHCALPYIAQDAVWIEESRKLYHDILSKADIVKTVSNETYHPWVMQKRNEYMVDRANLLLALWDGSPGGTANRVKYAEKKNIKTIIMTPYL